MPASDPADPLVSILLKKVGGGVSALFRESSSSSSFSSTQTLRKSRTRTKDEDGYDGRWGVCPMQLLFGGTFSVESILQPDLVRLVLCAADV